MSDKIIYPPLTAEKFADGAGYEYRGVPFVEDEHATSVFAYGHVAPALFAEVVNDYDRELLDGEPEFPYDAADVRHRWAVTVAPPEAEDGWLITWHDRYQDHPLRFPVTTVDR